MYASESSVSFYYELFFADIYSKCSLTILYALINPSYPNLSSKICLNSYKFYVSVMFVMYFMF